MKKLVILIAAMFIAASAYAQVGIIAGLTSSSTDLKSAYADINNINQYHVGVTYKMALGGMVAIQPSLIYNMKGQSVGSVSNVSSMNLDYKTGYLELPVQLQVGVNLLNVLRVYGIAEPFIGYAVSNKVSLGGKDVDLKDAWANVKNKFEYGVGLGAGVEAFKHVQVSVRYFWNLGSVYGKDIDLGTIKETIQESKCQGIVASVAYIF